MKFHTDECLDPAVAHGLRDRGIDVTTSQQAGLLGRSDLDQLAYARAEGRAIITQDANFLRLAARGEIHFRILYARPGSMSVGQIISAVERTQREVPEARLENTIKYLKPFPNA